MSQKKQIVVAVSGGFDPIHIGHVRLFKEAKKLGDKLVVILNNDNWLEKKKGYVFMPQKERREVIQAIDCVDEVVFTKHPKNPKDMTVCRELKELKPHVFANGGDRKGKNIVIPEVQVCREINCRDIYNIGYGGKIQSSSWLLSKYLQNFGPRRSIEIKKVLSEIKKSIRNSKAKTDPSLKLKVAELILGLMNKKGGFGLFVILGWKDKWRSYTDLPDAEQDIYVKHPVNIRRLGSGTKYDIAATVDFDGAILIDSKGNIVHSGIIIEGLKPRSVADKINPGKFKDLSEQFGFKQKVHSRHLSAITCSYIFDGTTVFTVSEENDSFHVFEHGQIAYSL